MNSNRQHRHYPANDPLPVKPFGKPIRRAMEYESLARDSQDRIEAEIYRQYAEYWHRVAKGDVSWLPEDQTMLQDLEKVSGFNKDFILQISQEVSWLRETTCRRTPQMVLGITRAETDGEAIYYADIVTATLVALLGKKMLDFNALVKISIDTSEKIDHAEDALFLAVPQQDASDFI